jgi:hypothetical protein
MNEEENSPAADAYTAPADGGGHFDDPPPDVLPPEQHPLMQEYRAALDAVEATDRAIATAHAERAAAIDRFRVASEQMSFATRNDTADQGWSDAVCAEQMAVMELVGVLRVCDNTARNLISQSRQLVNQFAGTFAALKEGSISYLHARVLIDQGSSVPDESVDRKVRADPAAAREGGHGSEAEEGGDPAAREVAADVERRAPCGGCGGAHRMVRARRRRHGRHRCEAQRRGRARDPRPAQRYRHGSEDGG